MIRGLFLAILLVAAVVAAEIHVPTSVALAAAEVKPQPEYGAMARQLKVAGDVAIEVHISVAGEVGEVKVLAGNALLAGSVEIFNLTKIDRWFLVQIKEIVDFEEELAGTKN